jgi:fructokinase
MRAMKIGIDMGGTKIEGIVLDDVGAELGRARAATPTGDYTATLEVVAGLVATLAQRHGVNPSVPVGVGIPGTVSPATGLIKNANSTCLIGHRLDADLAAKLGREVRLANDADCFAVSEAADGAGQGAGTVFGVILGTGVGGGLVVAGRLWVGPNAISGEWGHNPLPWPKTAAESPDGRDERPGRECYCGKRGCIETFLSGPGLEADYKEATGSACDAAAIVALAEAGDGDAEAALARYEDRLARALSTVINVVDPEVIVLGGGLSNVARLYENVPKLWQNWVFSDRCDTRLARNRHGDSSGVRGAAWLWP